MILKGIGAVCILAGCGGFGFSMATYHRREEDDLRQLLSVLDLAESELSYRLTPLPELMQLAQKETSGAIRKVFTTLRRELDAQISPDAASCMEAALSSNSGLPASVCAVLRVLGKSLGRFDLPGQQRGLEAARAQCRSSLEQLGRNRDQRLRSYQTLGLCAGAALAILLL